MVATNTKLNHYSLDLDCTHHLRSYTFTTLAMKYQVTALRASGRSGIRFDIVQGLQQTLDSVNPYVIVFRRARDMLRDHNEVSDLIIQII